MNDKLDWTAWGKSAADPFIHIAPNDDLKPHVLHAFTCWCKPTPYVEDESMVVHNSMDRREEFEPERIEGATRKVS